MDSHSTSTFFCGLVFGGQYKLFNRLNTGGSPLTDQEIRNCIFRGISSDFNNFLKKIAYHSDFVELIVPTERQRSELYLEELVLRFSSLYGNAHNVKQNISNHMTEFMRDAVKNNNFDYAGKEVLLMRVIALLKPLGVDVFRGKNGTFSTSLFEAITIGIAVNADHYESVGHDELDKRIKNLKADPEFEKNMGSASNNKVRIVNRVRIAEQIFAP